MDDVVIYCPLCGEQMGNLATDTTVHRLQCSRCNACYLAYRTERAGEGDPAEMLLSVMQVSCEQPHRTSRNRQSAR